MNAPTVYTNSYNTTLGHKYFLTLQTIYTNWVQRHAAGSSPCGLFNRELGFCVVAQKAEFGHLFAKLTYKFNNIFTSDIARKVEVEQIFKLSALTGTGFDFCEVKTERIESAQKTVQRSRNMRKRETKADSVRIFGNVQLFGYDNKPCCVLVIVLKMIVKNLQAVFLTRFV